MKSNICSRNVELRDGIKDYINSKFDKLKSSLENGCIKVVIEKDKGMYNIEILMSEDNVNIGKVECINEDLYSALDIAFEKIYSKLIRYKSKLKLSTDPLIIKDSEESKEDDEIIIKRRKKFNLKPMSIEEAVLQMELLGHNFFIFRNQDNYEINVVYKRKNGGYGLIEHE